VDIPHAKMNKEGNVMVFRESKNFSALVPQQGGGIFQAASRQISDSCIYNITFCANVSSSRERHPAI
jgi:hypothetical protein